MTLALTFMLKMAFGDFVFTGELVFHNGHLVLLEIDGKKFDCIIKNKTNITSMV